jgi:sugar phosphate permease
MPSNDLRRWQRRIVATLWITYASYYLCRVNLSIALPELEKLPGVGTEGVGWILTGSLLAYGVGQVVHGLLGDRFGARILGTLGMAVSALCNLAFGLVGSLPLFAALWALNGFSQATGAPLRIKTLAAWSSARSRGKLMGLLGTDYVFGNVVAWLLCGWLLAAEGWRSVFFVPGILFLVSAVHFALRIRNHPRDVGLAPPDAVPEAHHTDLRFVVRHSLLSPRVWVVALAYFGVDLFRYGFLSWSFAYLVEGRPEPSFGEDVVRIVMVPACGALGILASGWLSDRMGGRRAPIVCAMLLAAALLAGILRAVPRDDVILCLVLFGGIGFFLYGPHLIMGATLAIDLGTPRAAASASGVIDGVGYAGAAVAGVGTAWARRAAGWDGAFALWIGAAVFAALLMALLWRFRPPGMAEAEVPANSSISLERITKLR